MAALPRVYQKLFGSAGLLADFGKFGSLAEGSPANSKDIEQIMSLASWLGGWKNAVVGDNSPALEDMNAFCLLTIQQIAYILERGMAEWDAETTYPPGAYASVPGEDYFSGIFRARYTAPGINLNKIPFGNPDYWERVNDSFVQPGQITINGFTTNPIDPFPSNYLAGYLRCDGSEVSRTTYAKLYEVIQTAWGEGNGIDTFNLPDLRGYFIRGRSFNTGTSRDPDVASRLPLYFGGAAASDNGSYQDYAVESHQHPNTVTTISGPPGSLDFSGSPTNNLSATNPSGAYGGNETRPINAYVEFYIKY